MLNLNQPLFLGLTVCVGSTQNGGLVQDLDAEVEWNRWNKIFSRPMRKHVVVGSPLIDAHATKDRILDSIKAFVTSIKYGQTGVIVYYGHGKIEEGSGSKNGKLHYIIASDSTTSDNESLISETELRVAVEATLNQFARLVVIIDACREFPPGSKGIQAMNFTTTNEDTNTLEWKERPFMSNITPVMNNDAGTTNVLQSPNAAGNNILIISSCSDKQLALSRQMNTTNHVSVFGHLYQHVTKKQRTYHPMSFEYVINAIAMNIHRNRIPNQTPFVSSVELAKKWEAA